MPRIRARSSARFENVSARYVCVVLAICPHSSPTIERDLAYPELTLEEREAFGGWQLIAEQYSLETALQIGDIEWVNNLHHQHARRGFTEDVSRPRHLLRVWLRDSELSPVLPADIKNKFAPMFNVAPDFYPLDEIEEDEWRKQTGVFTASCDKDTASERLEKGIVVANP